MHVNNKKFFSEKKDKKCFNYILHTITKIVYMYIIILSVHLCHSPVYTFYQ